MTDTPDYARLIEKLFYRVENPSAWPEGFDQEASNLMGISLTAIRTLLERGAALERLLAAVRDDAMRLDNDFCAMEARVKELEEAIKVKGGTEHAPTEWAYLKVCEIADKYKARAEQAEPKLAEAMKVIEPFARDAKNTKALSAHNNIAHVTTLRARHLRAARDFMKENGNGE